MNEKDMQILLEQNYRFIGISNKKSQKRIFELLCYCKEIRDTAYPMKGSKATELEIVEFCAHKEKDLIYVNGSLTLDDGFQHENRCFEAYIIEEKNTGRARIYLDITRLCVNDEPKMIRTSDDIYEKEDSIIDLTNYTLTDATEKKEFAAEVPKTSPLENIVHTMSQQISAL